MKHDFGELFKRPNFEGKVKRPSLTRRSQIRKDADGNIMYEEVPRKKGALKWSFMQKHHLTKETTPDQYANIFLPFTTNKIGTKEYPSFQLFTKWTNQKAHHSGAGPGGTGYYPSF